MVRPVLTNDAETLADASDEVRTALDACEAGDPRAYKLLAGLPCTMVIATDSYPATIVRATPSLKLIVVEAPDGEQIAFRWRESRKSYRSEGRGHMRLDVGIAHSKHALES